MENRRYVSLTVFPDSVRRAGFSAVQGWVAEYDVSQFSSVLLLVTALTLTVCVGVAAWRISDDTSEVTGTILPPLSDPR